MRSADLPWRSCAGCRYWEPLYDDREGPAEHRRGLCTWATACPIPVCLSPQDGLLQPSMLAGAGKNCEAWKSRREEDESG